MFVFLILNCAVLIAQDNLFNKINSNIPLTKRISEKINRLKAKESIKRGEEIILKKNISLSKNYRGVFNIFDKKLEFEITEDFGTDVNKVHGYKADLNEGGYAIISNSDNGINVAIWHRDDFYNIEQIEGMIYFVTEVDLGEIARDENQENLMGIKNIDRMNKSTSETLSSAIRVFVAYTPAVLAAYNGDVNLVNQLINGCRNISIVAFNNSEVSTTIELAGSAQLTYTESGDDYTDVTRLMNMTDGYLDQIHSLRKTYEADVCVLIVNTLNSNGRVPNGAIGASYNNSFFVVKASSAVSYYSFPHELGHLLGCRHHNDKGTDPYPFAHGFYWYGLLTQYSYQEDHYKTIMATTAHTRVPYFSNPYVEDDSDNQMGSLEYYHSARAINLHSPTIAAFEPKYTTAGMLIGNETWRGTINLTGNVEVPSGIVLTINDNAEVNLNGFLITSTGGVITAESGAEINGVKAYLKAGSTIKGYFSSIQPAINYSAAYQTIELINTTYNESISITNKPRVTLKGTTNYGSIINGNITVTNSDWASLQNLKMHDYHSITINGGTRTDLSFIKYMASSTLVNVYNGAFTTIGGIEDGGGSTSPAINCSNSSANIMGANITDYDFGIWSASNSSITVSYGSYFCNNLLDLFTYSGGSIYVTGSTLSASWPQSVSGDVSHGLLYDPCTQKMGKSGLLTSIPKDDPFPEELTELNSEYLQLLNRINLENQDNPNFSIQEYKPSFLDLISRYKLLLRKDSNNKTVNAVLSKIAHCYYIIDEKDLLKTYLDNLTMSSIASQFLPYINRHYIDYYVEDGDFESAITIAEQVYNSSVVDEDVKCEMLYEKGVIFKYYLNDIDKAMAAFAQIVEKYPNNNLYYFAKTELEAENVFIAKEANTSNNEEVSKYTTAAYPNPFNPSTKINYSIPKRGNVILKVYDVLGREIVELVNEVKEVGKYQVNFDGSNLNSGVYFYTIESGKYRESKKLLLVK